MPEGTGTTLARTLVGRDAELRTLQEAWRVGGAAHVVIAGAGVGKSRLVRELATWVQAAGGLVVAGRGSATGQDMPLRPWREALLAAARAGRRPGPDLDPFVPALARVVPEWGEASADTSALTLGEGVLRLLSSWATPGAGALIVIEDLQWADRESLGVLEYVVDNVAGTRVLVLSTLRDGEPGPGADLVADLAARRAVGPLRLEPLGDEDVLALARSCLAAGGADLPPGAVGPLLARSEGVPFLVEELLATAVRAGWGSIADGVPGSVAASVGTRLEGLPPPARPLLLAAALMGRHFDWLLAAAAAGVPAETAAELLRRGVQTQLLDVDGPSFRFRHALTRDAVLASAVPGEQSRLAARALEALTETDPALPGDRCVLAAQLAAIAGDVHRAAGLWLDGAERALADGSLGSAESLATRARDVAGGEGARAADRTLLRIYARAGQTSRADELGRALLASGAEPDERADVHLVLGAAAVAAGRWDDADVHAAATRTSVAGEDARVAQADVLGAQAAMGRAEPELAVALARSALNGGRRTGQPTVECEALEVIGRAERGRDLAAAEAAFSEALTIATTAGLRLWRVRAMQELGTIDMFGSLSTERLVTARRLAVEAGALATAAVIDLQLGALHEERGEMAEALAAAKRSEVVSRRWRLSTLPMSLAVQAFVHAQAGDGPAMEAAIDAALATGEDRHHVEARAQGSARATLHIVGGDLLAAVRAADAGMAVLRAHPGATHTFPGLWALLHTLLDDGGDAARAEVAALPVDTPVSRTLLAAADAVAAGQAGDTAEAERGLAEVARRLPGPGGTYRRAFVRHLVAPAAHAGGWGDAPGWLREALATFETTGHHALAARCRVLLKDAGAPVPRKGRGEVGDVPAPLAALGITSREVDVLALVAAGATNREVGERLFISTRTVDKHVERLLQKTGTTRAGLAALARDAGLLPT